MRWLSLPILAMVLAACVVAGAQTPSSGGLGRPASEEEIRALDIAVGPAGKELPPGGGTPLEGAAIFAKKCVACHGQNGEGTKLAPQLVGGSLQLPKPVKTIGSYWPFATTIWDYIRRAMPFGQEGTLKPEEVYALTAFLLYKNGIVQENDRMDANTLPKVQMPNRQGFRPPPLSEWKPGMPRPFRIDP